MHVPDAIPWGKQLRQERILRNWRQHDLAEQLGTTVLTIQRWERGSHLPSPYFRVKLCALFGKSAEELGLVVVNPSSQSSTQQETSEARSTPPSPVEKQELWTVPYLRNPHFTGRDDLLDRLARHFVLETLEEAMVTRQALLSQTQAIKGLGGIGKTQIAIEYAYRSRQQGRYTHIFWINAVNEEAIITSFLLLAELLPAFSTKGETNQHKVIIAVKDWLERCQKPWLLIFDNVDDLSLVQRYIPQQGHGSILLTTRAQAIAALAGSFQVEKMGLMEGTQFLLHRTQRLHASDEEWNEATNIVIALDGFPLALDQAAAYIEETGCSFGDYLQFYEQYRMRLLARRGKQITNYPDSVATTWWLSFQKIEQEHPAAAELLRLCAYLSPDHIPEELIIDGATHWPPALQQAVVDRFTFNEQLEVLLAFSLVKRLAEERLLSVHRLVQTIQVDRMCPQDQRRWAERVVCAVNTLFPADPKNKTDSWPQCLRYLDQVQACDTLIQQYCLQLPEAADLLERAGIYLREHSNYNLAETLFQRALAIARQQLGPEHLQVASSLNNLGLLYKYQGKHNQAEPLLQQALYIREQALGAEHFLVAITLNNLGNLYVEQGLYEQAEPLFQRALCIREQALGPDHLQVAMTLTNLGNLYKDQGKHNQAEPLLWRALHILELEQSSGSHPSQLAYPFISLGELYSEQGLYEQAEPLLQRALHILELAWGPDHPHVASSLDSLGNLYYKKGEYEQAEPLLQRALYILELALGPDHPDVAYPLNGLANLSREQGRYEQADAFYLRVLALRRQHMGPQHIGVAETLHNLARLRQMQQQPTEALSFYEQALAMRECILGVDHPKSSETRECLRAVLSTLDKIQEATAFEG